jgi:hypothetical protein
MELWKKFGKFCFLFDRHGHIDKGTLQKASPMLKGEGVEGQRDLDSEVASKDAQQAKAVLGGSP